MSRDLRSVGVPTGLDQARRGELPGLHDHRGGRSMLVIGGQAPAIEMLVTRNP